MIAIDAIRHAQQQWAQLPLAERLIILDRLRPLLAEQAAALAAGITLGSRRQPGQSLIYEILPLADAVRWLVQEAPRILRPQYLGRRGLPLWLGKITAQISYQPFGVIGILAPFNYPLYLPAVQALQALAAGNAVIIKPAPTGIVALRLLQTMLRDCGLPDGLFTLLGADLASAEALVRLPPDKLILTGSAATGRKVLAQLATTLTPAVMELSGNDAVLVLPGADAALLVDALRFGLMLNHGATCIAPRRLILIGAAAALLPQVLETLTDLPALEATPVMIDQVAALRADAVARNLSVSGGVSHGDQLTPLIIQQATPDCAAAQADIFAPVLTIMSAADTTAALTMMEACRYALGASIFGPECAALRLAEQLPVGTVTINDLIAPTADPRLGFGGLKHSGFGKTRGAAGLREMVVERTVSSNQGRLRPHYAAWHPSDGALFGGLLTLLHGKERARFKQLGAMTKAAAKRPWPRWYKPNGD
jgi:acyl-CoA reductase-like NAD-dependent aldehyde dehydrogenase